MSYRVPPSVHFRAVNDEAVLLDARAERAEAYFGFNTTAAVVWGVLADSGSPDEAIDELVARFEVTPEVARADVAAMVEQLVARGLLERVAK